MPHRPFLSILVPITVLVLSGCEPIRLEVLHPAPPSVPEEVSPEQPDDAGVEPPDAGPVQPDAGVEPPDAGSQQPDAGEAGSCYEELLLGSSVAFDLDTQGVGHFASIQNGQPWLQTTRSGALPEAIPIDSQSIAGLKIDAWGHRHLILYPTGYGSLRVYAHDQEGDWRFISLSQGRSLDLVLEASGAVNELFTDSQGDPLYYASNRSGVWVSERIDTLLSGGYTRPRLAIDSRGHAHIVYQTSHAQGIHYATNATGSWVLEWVDNQGKGQPAIALDSMSQPHLLYLGPDGHYFHSTKTASGWQRTRVASGGGDSAGLQVDASGTLHIVFNDSGNSLSYANDAGGTWTVTPLLSIKEPARPLTQVSFILDAWGRPLVGYEQGNASNSTERTVRFVRPGACP